MEKRREPRIPVDHEVGVTLLGGEPLQLTGRISNISGRGIRLLLPQKIALGTALRVDWPDGLLLGEVCYCQAEEGGGFSAGLTLEHVLYNLHELAALARQLLNEPVGLPEVTTPARP